MNCTTPAFLSGWKVSCRRSTGMIDRRGAIRRAALMNWIDADCIKERATLSCEE
ncbi:MAG: hypothetical protein WC998_04420 [Candidatus Paceibacterota bacterium]